MAKIQSVELLSIPEEIHIGDNISDISVITSVEFHPIDIKLNMEYCLHLFVYDIHGEVDPPIMLPNWDESQVISFTLDRRDEFLGMASKKVFAETPTAKFTIPMALKLGDHRSNRGSFSKKLEVFATIAPAVGRASMWSEPFESMLLY